MLTSGCAKCKYLHTTPTRLPSSIFICSFIHIFIYILTFLFVHSFKYLFINSYFYLLIYFTYILYIYSCRCDSLHGYIQPCDNICCNVCLREVSDNLWHSSYNYSEPYTNLVLPPCPVKLNKVTHSVWIYGSCIIGVYRHISTTGATNGADTANPSGAPQFIPGF